MLSFPVIVLFILPMVASAQKTTAEVATDLPSGWIHAPSRLQNPGLWQCAAYGGSWIASSDGGNIKLVRLTSEAGKQVQLPSQLKLSKKMIGRRSLQPTSTGWLAGFNAGEFGGGLWWFNRDGSQNIELLSENVHAIYQANASILILTGLNHMGLNYGHLYKFTDISDKPTVISVANLGGSPEASTVGTDGNIVVATSERVLRVDACGKIVEIYKSGEQLTYPTSIGLGKNRILYVAMRFFVLRLVPDEGGGYNAQWLMPKQCREFRLDKYICDCNAK